MMCIILQLSAIFHGTAGELTDGIPADRARAKMAEAFPLNYSTDPGDRRGWH
jgi:hypothetical protein